jgi:hypothetical protein
MRRSPSGKPQTLAPAQSRTWRRVDDFGIRGPLAQPPRPCSIPPTEREPADASRPEPRLGTISEPLAGFGSDYRDRDEARLTGGIIVRPARRQYEEPGACSVLANDRVEVVVRGDSIWLPSWDDLGRVVRASPASALSPFRSRRRDCPSRLNAATRSPRRGRLVLVHLDHAVALDSHAGRPPHCRSMSRLATWLLVLSADPMRPSAPR